MSLKQIMWALCLILIWCMVNSNCSRLRPYYAEQKPSYRMTIMIDPSAHARIIDGCFEFGPALQCAERLKQALEKEYPHLRILLTWSPGQTPQPLQNATFANRLNVDLYLSIHFYQEKETKPKLYLYHFSYGHDTISTRSDLCFYPYEQAYLFSKEQTTTWAQQLKQTLSQEKWTALFEVKGPYTVPFKPLIGIKAPALAFEIGLKKSTDWKQYIEPITASLEPIIMSYQKSGDEM